MVDNVRISDNVEQGARGGPNFSTIVITLANGREGRNQEWQVARHSWNIGYGITTPEEFQEVRDFYMARRGRARSFRFKDWSDYRAVLQPMAAVAGDATKRQLVKIYDDTSHSNPYVRLINFPVASSLHIYVDTLETVAFTLGSNGVVTFTGGDPGVNVVATFDFDIPVRFDTDQLPVTFQNFLSVEMSGINIIEVTNDDPQA